MSVKSILDEKGRQVVTVDPGIAVRDAANLLHENRIGAVVVIEEGDRIAGIFTERDVVTSIAKYGVDCLDKPVSSVLWSRLHTCTEDTTIDALMEMMSELRTRHLPVEKNGRLVGIVSIGDAVKNHIRAIEQEAQQIKAYIAG